MKIPYNVLKSFAKEVTAKSDSAEASELQYGIIMSKNGDNEVTVKLDGSNIETPAELTMDADINERVMVKILDHKAIVVGNSSSPASAKTATAFMKLTDEGLVIGNINNKNEPLYLLLSTDGEYKIMQQSISNEIEPKNDWCIAYFNSNSISLLNSVNVDEYDPELDGYALSITTDRSEDESIIHPGISYIDSKFNLHLRSEKDINLLAGEDYKIKFSIMDSNSHTDINNNPCVMRHRPTMLSAGISDPILTANTAYQVDTITTSTDTNGNANGIINGNSSVTFVANPAPKIDPGHSLAGILGVTSNHANACHITSFYANSGKLYARFTNTSDQNIPRSNVEKMIVTFRYLTLPTKIK